MFVKGNPAAAVSNPATGRIQTLLKVVSVDGKLRLRTRGPVNPVTFKRQRCGLRGRFFLLMGKRRNVQTLQFTAPHATYCNSLRMFSYKSVSTLMISDKVEQLNLKKRRTLLNFQIGPFISHYGVWNPEIQTYWNCKLISIKQCAAWKSTICTFWYIYIHSVLQ